MEVQPKVGGVKGEKSNSDIVYELADSIKEKIALHIDVDMCNPAHLEASIYTLRKLCHSNLISNYVQKALKAFSS